MAGVTVQRILYRGVYDWASRPPGNFWNSNCSSGIACTARQDVCYTSRKMRVVLIPAVMGLGIGESKYVPAFPVPQC
jgi:hypothetical protein